MLDFLSNPHESYRDWLERMKREAESAADPQEKHAALYELLGKSVLSFNKTVCDAERKRMRDDERRLAELDNACGVNEPCDQDGRTGDDND